MLLLPLSQAVSPHMFSFRVTDIQQAICVTNSQTGPSVNCSLDAVSEDMALARHADILQFSPSSPLLPHIRCYPGCGLQHTT